MKIGLVIYGSIDTVSGGYLYDRKLVAYLRARGDELRIISIPGGDYVAHLLGSLRARLPAGLDVIIEDELVHPSLLLANARRPIGTPLVSLVHNLHSSERRAAWKNSLYREVERVHLASVDGFIFNSTVTQAAVAALVGDSKPRVLAPPGGDRLGRLTRDTVQQRLARGGPLQIVFLANVTPLKGLHVVLEALERLPRDTCMLHVAGSLDVDVPYATRMQQQAGRLSTPVTFHGVVDDQPLADLLARCDLLVLPSFYEGFGIAYLEGMAFGLPAIGTTAGAIPQMIHDDVNGYTIIPGDSATLENIITRLAADRGLLSRLSLGALGYFASQPTWEDSGEIIRGFLRAMCGQNRSHQT